MFGVLNDIVYVVIDVCHVVSITYQTIEKPVLQELLGSITGINTIVL